MSETDGGSTEAGDADAGEPLDLTARVIAQGARHRLFERPVDPVRIGRYAVVSPLGQGGMGAVFMAYDPTLDRKVAIKLVHPQRARDEVARERMLREARAMARVSHAHVLHVYEAGEHQGQVFLAMEYVEGTTLGVWLRAKPRSVPEITAMFVRVGEGLVAAHAAGVVHRDFKPDNVLVTAAELPKVADFGLAQLHGTLDPSSSSGGDEDMDEPALTRTGVNLGTPRYRAPEQQSGHVADEATDQFAFCVAMHEALFRVHPFVGTTAMELRESIVAGRRAPVPNDTPVPSWLREVVSRGLAVDPKERHVSMAALVSALVADPSRRRRRVAGVLVGSVLVVGGAGSWWALGGTPPPCTDGPERLGGAWNDARREEVVTAISSVPGSYAAETAKRVAGIVDDYREDWLAAYRDACEATRVHARQTEARLELRTECLDRHRRSLAALADVLTETDASSLPLATGAALGLPAIDDCADPDPARMQRHRPDAVPSDEAAELADGLARAYALFRAGRYDRARELADDVAVRAEAAQWPALQAEALYIVGNSLVELGDIRHAIVELQRAYHAADAGGDDRLRVFVAGKLIYASAASDQAPDDPPWLEHAWAALRRQGGDPAYESVLRGSIGSLRRQQGKLELALIEHRRALALSEEFGSDPMRVAVCHNEAGNDLSELGRAEESVVEYEATERIIADLLGPAHPHVGLAHDNIAQALSRMGRTEEALVEHRRALEILEPALGPEHMSVALCRGNIAKALSDLGRADEALPIHREVLARLTAVLGPRHRIVAQAHSSVSDSLVALGDFSGALEHSLAAVEIDRAVLPADHPSLGLVHLELARVYGRMMRHSEALEHLRHAERIFLGGGSGSIVWLAHTETYITMELGLLALAPTGAAP